MYINSLRLSLILDVLLSNKLFSSGKLWYSKGQDGEKWSLKKIDRDLTNNRQMDMFVTRYINTVTLEHQKIGKGEKR